MYILFNGNIIVIVRYALDLKLHTSPFSDIHRHITHLRCENLIRFSLICYFLKRPAEQGKWIFFWYVFNLWGASDGKDQTRHGNNKEVYCAVTEAFSFSLQNSLSFSLIIINWDELNKQGIFITKKGEIY